MLNIEYLQQEVGKIENNIKDCESKLKLLMKESEFTTYKVKLEGFLGKHKREQEETKHHKWYRDNEDYKKGYVYNWQREDTREIHVWIEGTKKV